MNIQVSGGHHTDHYYRITEAMENFSSVADACATKEVDKQSIDQEVVAQFGNYAAADNEVRRLLADYLADFQTFMRELEKDERRDR